MTQSLTEFGEVPADKPGFYGDVIDLDRLLDDRPVSAFQLWIFLLCGIVGIMDGLNTQSIGVAAKPMAIDFHMRMASFGPVFSAMLLGATIGAVVFGALGDRLGRKQPIVAAIAIMAIFTLLTPLMHSFMGLIVTRFLLGLGLGGATPCFLALGAEYAPERLRQRISALLWLGFPIGVTLGAFLNAYLIAHYTWQTLFYVGGIVPALLLVPIVLGLPESIRFLIARDKKPAAIAAIMRRLAPDVQLKPGTRFVAPHERVEPGSVERPPPGPSMVVTLALWAGFMAIFGALVVITLWGPALLAQHGMPASQAAIAVGFNGFGALFGIVATGPLLDRFGKMAIVVGLVLCTMALIAIGFVGTTVVPAIIFMAISGFFLGLASSGAIALAVQLYPTALRSRGVGWAMGAGRFGQFIGPLVISVLVLKLWPASGIFGAMAAMSALGALFILAIRRDAPKI